MLAAWTEILPLFVVRWLAKRLCERVSLHRESHLRWAAIARRDVLIVVSDSPSPIPSQDTKE